jgi:hypothetical protein
MPVITLQKKRGSIIQTLVYVLYYTYFEVKGQTCSYIFELFFLQEEEFLQIL